MLPPRYKFVFLAMASFLTIFSSCAPKKKVAKTEFLLSFANTESSSSLISVWALKDPLAGQEVEGNEQGESLLKFNLTPSSTSIKIPFGKWSFYVLEAIDGDWRALNIFCGKSEFVAIEDTEAIVDINITRNECLNKNLPYKKMLTEKGGTYFCPLGYERVPENSNLGVDAFCVMKFEAKNVSGAPRSQAAGTPWNVINIVDAKAKCNSLGNGYDLISNPEWMAISYEIEKTAANWSGATVGSGMLNRGHTDNSTASPLAVFDISDPYNGTGNNFGQPAGSGWEQKRTHTLSNGTVLWDIAGNVWEWIDWSLGGGLTSGPTSCVNAVTELPDVSCGALSAADYLPDNPSGQTASSYNSSYGLGTFFGGTGGTAYRGGCWGDNTEAGIFTLKLATGTTNTFSCVGFRCVYRP